VFPAYPNHMKMEATGNSRRLNHDPATPAPHLRYIEPPANPVYAAVPATTTRGKTQKATSSLADSRGRLVRCITGWPAFGKLMEAVSTPFKPDPNAEESKLL